MTVNSSLNPSHEEMQLVTTIADRFIQKSDVKAIQMPNGAYIPDIKLKTPGAHAPLGWHGRHILAHLQGQRTYGNYLLDASNQCKLFALDVDLEESGTWWEFPNLESLPTDMSDEEFNKLTVEHECNPRELWTDRSATGARSWFKYQMHAIAHKFVSVITSELKIPCAAAYSGAKGVHVYGFTGAIPAGEAREGALLVLDMLGEFDLLRGKNFFKHKQEGIFGFKNFSVEIYPKQDQIHNKDGLGNLLRLPLGRNLKSTDPTFFLDMTAPLYQLQPHPDPIRLLTGGEPFK